jgi:hypothetical protein
MMRHEKAQEAQEETADERRWTQMRQEKFFFISDPCLSASICGFLFLSELPLRLLCLFVARVSL